MFQQPCRICDLFTPFKPASLLYDDVIYYYSTGKTIYV